MPRRTETITYLECSFCPTQGNDESDFTAIILTAGETKLAYDACKVCMEPGSVFADLMLATGIPTKPARQAPGKGPNNGPLSCPVSGCNHYSPTDRGRYAHLTRSHGLRGGQARDLVAAFQAGGNS